jgi:hypothetical protein
MGASFRDDQPIATGPVAPVVLTILDGWGYRHDDAHNAIRAADTPVMDALWHAYPHTLIEASGAAVGLPDDQMGNSEVGISPSAPAGSSARNWCASARPCAMDRSPTIQPSTPGRPAAGQRRQPSPDRPLLRWGCP